MLKKILYADGLVVVLMSETTEELREKLHEWKEAFESKLMKFNLGRTNVKVSGSEGEMTPRKIDPWGMCGKSVIAISILSTICKKLIQRRCTKIKWVTPSLANNFVCARCRKVVKTAVEPVDKLCNEVETVSDFCYLVNRFNASGRCETAVAARIYIEWMKFRECGKFLSGKTFPLKAKGIVYRTCVKSAMLYGGET